MYRITTFQKDWSNLILELSAVNLRKFHAKLTKTFLLKPHPPYNSILQSLPINEGLKANTIYTDKCMVYINIWLF